MHFDWCPRQSCHSALTVGIKRSYELVVSEFDTDHIHIHSFPPPARRRGGERGLGLLGVLLSHLLDQLAEVDRYRGDFSSGTTFPPGRVAGRSPDPRGTRDLRTPPEGPRRDLVRVLCKLFVCGQLFAFYVSLWSTILAYIVLDIQ